MNLMSTVTTTHLQEQLFKFTFLQEEELESYCMKDVLEHMAHIFRWMLSDRSHREVGGEGHEA
jgi:hypothetical protein